MSDSIRLTAGSKAGGCAAKMSPRMLDSVLRRLPASSHPAVVVGYETSDDAGVYRLNHDLALVQTVDFFTPIVDDPFTFGQIFRGGLLKMAEAECVVLGGHSIRDEEIKFGYAVTGVIHPDRVWRNVGA